MVSDSEPVSETPAKGFTNGEGGRIWGPGPGRPKGSKNKRTIEVQEAARVLVRDGLYQQNLIKRLRAGQAPHMETLLWHYAYGKPKETIEVHGEVVVEKIVREIVDAPSDVIDVEPQQIEATH